ncbi:MAG TPA: IucA/IucC family protein [Solirubrobacteraceae bacterium]|nr:IucA/IucC family protein [Solirubrobacteraceae bacterium]
MDIKIHEETAPLPPSAREDVQHTRGHEAAVRATTETLLNCYTREGGEWRPVPAASVPEFAQEGDEFVAVLPFPDERTAVLAGVRHLSPTHRHRFRAPAHVAMAGGKPWAIGIDTLMGMLADELGSSESVFDDDISAAGTRGPDPTFLLARVRQHIATVGAVLDARADDVDRLWNAEPMSFADSEQAGLLGHMAHPAAKSRWELGEQTATFAPESQAHFALRWLAVDPALVEQDSAAGTPAAELVEQLLREDPAVDGEALDAVLAQLGPRVLLPVHPWELERLREQKVVADLMADGRIADLGAMGSEVTPTTSVATIYNPDWSWQLTFQLHVHVPDEMRIASHPEMQRAVDAARELDDERGASAAELAPDLTLLQDPAYLAVHVDGRPVEGLAVQLRENRWRRGSEIDVSSLEVLVQDHPFGGTSRLGQIVARLAEQTGRSQSDVAREWFARYCDIAIVPLLRLYAELGLSIETDQQNTLLELEGGWPVRCVLRDARGVFVGQAAHDDIAVGGAGIGEGPFLDNALGVINALGVAGAIAEIELLRDLKALLERERDRGDRAATLLERLLTAPTWPCKAQMRSGLHEEDTYIELPNPLHGVRD